MSDLVRADRPLVYAHRSINPGETFLTEKPEHTMMLVARGKVTLVESNYVPPVMAQVYETREEVAQPEKRKRGRPRGSKNVYKRRDMVAE